MQGDNLSFNRQLANHLLIVSRIKIMMWVSGGRDYLAKCLYTVGFGSNDYINNYFLPQFYSTSRIYPSPDRYAAVLIQQYSLQLKVSVFSQILFFSWHIQIILIFMLYVFVLDFVHLWSKENSSIRAGFLRLRSCRNGHV